MEAILEAIRQSGTDRARAIEEHARAEVAQVIAEAEREAAAIRQEAREAASVTTAADQARIVHRASLEAMHIVSEAEQQIVEQALDHVRTQLAGLRASADYPDVLRDLLTEALAALQGSLLVGDVHPAVAEVAGALTPVPGGVGPLTIAMLMRNTLRAAEAR